MIDVILVLAWPDPSALCFSGSTGLNAVYNNDVKNQPPAPTGYCTNNIGVGESISFFIVYLLQLYQVVKKGELVAFLLIVLFLRSGK